MINKEEERKEYKRQLAAVLTNLYAQGMSMRDVLDLLEIISKEIKRHQ